MTKLVASQRRSEQGFTLVELAIVMVIIGLLIGGILKGQELIATAKISATVSQVKALDGAINTFQEKYAAYPGDMTTPNTRLPNCTTSPCSVAGNGNSLITNGTDTTMGNAANAPTGGTTGEGTRAFTHLSAADLISGIDSSVATSTFGRTLPAVKAGGGLWIGYTSTAAASGITTLVAGRHYAMLNGSPVAMGATSGGFNSMAAAQIDRKMDDGRPASGGAQTIGTNCADATGAYAEATPAGACAMYIRIMN